ncbi:MAG: hypothetical protein WAM47_08915, partial [Candidatus Sulfotelmatobacter sp.]
MDRHRFGLPRQTGKVFGSRTDGLQSSTATENLGGRPTMLLFFSLCPPPPAGTARVIGNDIR